MREGSYGSGNRGGSNRRSSGGSFRGGSRDSGSRGGYGDRDSGSYGEGGRSGFGGGGSYGGGSRGFDRGPREMHKAICADCKKECTVPFKPTEGKPVYCRECFQKRKDNE